MPVIALQLFAIFSFGVVISGIVWLGIVRARDFQREAGDGR